MVPQNMADDAAAFATIASPDPAELALLRSPERPIVLMRKAASFALSSAIAPGLDEIGLMLPYSPLHDLLLGDFGGSLVATSGNVSGEPVLTDESPPALSRAFNVPLACPSAVTVIVTVAVEVANPLDSV